MHIFMLLLWLSSGVLVAQESFSYKDDKELLERVVRVEERLLNVQKNIELLMRQINQQHADMQYNMDKRLEQVDKRFDTLYWILGMIFLVILGAFGFLFKMVYDNGKRMAQNSSKLDFLCRQNKLQEGELNRDVWYN